MNKKYKKIQIYKTSWIDLTPRQKAIREKSLEILSIAKSSKQSLSEIAKKNHISVRTVINNTNAFKKVSNKWSPKKFDRISRVIKINENGKERSIEIKDSRIASSIGSYHNVVKQFLNTGDKKSLSEFRNKRIKDAHDKLHKFETNPKKIININERIEEPEFYEIYGDGN